MEFKRVLKVAAAAFACVAVLYVCVGLFGGRPELLQGLKEQYAGGSGMPVMGAGRQYFLRSAVTTVLILVNVIVFLLETRAGGSTKTSVALKFGAQYAPYVKRGEYYRLFTAMFLHFGVYHLLFNMYALSVLGPSLEMLFGPVRYLILYLVSGLAGNLLTLFMENRSGRSSVSAGASGCIFGLMGACLMLALRGYGFSLQSILTTLAVNLIYGFSSKRINMKAHLGGLLGGACLTMLMI